MLHEILFALCGIPGDIFKLQASSSSQPNIQFKTSPHFPFLHPAERESLDVLIQIGLHYKLIDEFVLQHSHEPEKLLETPLKGFYLQAFCQSLSDILSEYRFHLAKIERELLSNYFLNLSEVKLDTLDLTRLQTELEKYRVIFPELLKLINVIQKQGKEKGFTGMNIIGILETKCQTGNIETQRVFKGLLRKCLRVFLKQLCGLLLFGQLNDPYNEFFVLKESSDERTNFHCREAILPKMLTKEVKENTIFIAKAIISLQNKQNGVKRLENFHSNKSVKEIQDYLEKDLINATTLELFTNQIKHQVAESLWKFISEEANLLAHLTACRNMFLLGDGMLSMNFIDASTGMALRQNHLPDGKDMTELYHKEYRKLYFFQNESHLDPLSSFCFVTRSPLPPNNQGLFGIPVVLTYKVRWPLDWVFEEDHISKYSSLFSFLMMIQKARVQLRDWCRIKQVERNKANIKLFVLWKVRGTIMFFVDCLWNYAQADIIQENFEIMVNAIKMVKQNRNFDDLLQAHHTCINTIYRQCFMESPALSQTIRECFGYIEDFFSLTERLLGELEQLNAIGKAVDNGAILNVIKKVNPELLKVERLFMERVHFFFRALSGVRGKKHLDQLLLRLDFNKWFSLANKNEALSHSY